MNEKTVCLFGDSITWGSDDYKNGGWAGLLRNHLAGIEPWTQVCNLGICGDTTADLLKRFSVEAAARKPTHIIFAIGINDSKPRVKITPAIFSKNLSKIYELARKHTHHIAFLGLTRVDDAHPENLNRRGGFTNSRIEIYDKSLEKFCKKISAPYLSLAEILKPSDLSDGLHPNVSGHRKLYKKILPFVESWI